MSYMVWRASVACFAAVVAVLVSISFWIRKHRLEKLSNLGAIQTSALRMASLIQIAVEAVERAAAKLGIFSPINR